MPIYYSSVSCWIQSFPIQLDVLPYGILFLQITCGTDGECTPTEVFCVFYDANPGPHLIGHCASLDEKYTP